MYVPIKGRSKYNWITLSKLNMLWPEEAFKAINARLAAAETESIVIVITHK